MPRWSNSSRSEMSGTLADTWTDLNKEIESSPPFQQVAGVSSEELFEHSLEAVGVFLNSTTVAESDVRLAMVQVYALGFVVGNRFGERHRSQSEKEQ